MLVFLAMAIPQFKTITEQVAAYLREEIQTGRWRDGMPGQKLLSKSLGVSGQTVELALQILEKEGLLVGQGGGRRRRIEQTHGATKNRALRVMILLYEESDRKTGYLVELFHQLRAAGHEAEFATKTMWDLGMDVKRISRFVDATQADAWVVLAGPRDVLEWFAARDTPAFSLFGRLLSVSIAGTGPHKSTVMGEVVRHLVKLGHSRIVMLAREERRKPEPGRVERAFLEELQNQGIATSSYNMPDWEDNPKGFQRCLSSLFKYTAPTALVISTIELFSATQQFLVHRGIRVPQDVSLICSDPHPDNAWCEPTISHISSYDSDAWLRIILRWVKNVSRGKNDRRQIFTKVDFIDGGTVGQVPNGRSR